MKFLKNLFSPDERLLKKTTKRATEIYDLYKINYKDKDFENILDIYKSIEVNGIIEENQVIACLIRISELSLGLRPYIVQVVGILLSSGGYVIEMKTGEGKTLVAILSAIFCLKIQSSKKVYIVTVNDYLAERDFNLIQELVENCFLTSSCVLSDDDNTKKKLAYSKDIIYVTNTNLAFDYLRDNMVFRKSEEVLGCLDFVIIDEIDSILIDEARTPLIISSKGELNNDLIVNSFNVAKSLDKNDYKLNQDSKNVELTNSGILKCEKKLGIQNLYSKNHFYIAHQIIKSLQGIHLYQKDVDYVVEDDLIKIIDSNTGRISEGVRWSEGLHHSIECKENVQLQETSVTNATITYQSFFNLFKKKSGMSGTVKTERKEFKIMYDLDIIQIPTNKPIRREDKIDLLFPSIDKKDEFLIRTIKDNIDNKLPTLIGTLSIEQSEKVEKLCLANGLNNIEVLNAKNHKREAEIIANAGQENAVTIATNMAGRGVDIKLSQSVKETGGLQLIGYERFHNRRIDNQLIGRSGRQGEKGSSIFLLSVTDKLLRFPENDEDLTPMQRLTKKTLMDFESGASINMLADLVKKTQITMEGHHFEQRKTLFRLDKSFSSFRTMYYSTRKKILNEDDNDFFKNSIKTYFQEIIVNSVKMSLDTVDNTINASLLEQHLKELGFNIDLDTILKLINKTDSTDNLENELLTMLEDRINNTIVNNNEHIRVLFLQTMDKQWQDFLSKADNIKSGIWFRQQTQKDPTVEYQKELEIYFESLMKNIKYNIIRELLFSLSDELLSSDFDFSLEEYETNLLLERSEELEHYIENMKNTPIQPLEELVFQSIDLFTQEFIEKHRNTIVTYIHNPIKFKTNLEDILKEYQEVFPMATLSKRYGSLKTIEEDLIIEPKKSIELFFELISSDTKESVLKNNMVKAVEYSLNDFNTHILKEYFDDRQKLSKEQRITSLKQNLSLLDTMIQFTFLALNVETLLQTLEENKIEEIQEN